MQLPGRGRPSEAPERLRADKCQGGGTQGGKEATWTAAAGSAAWIRDQLPEILRLDPDIKKARGLTAPFFYPSA